MHGRKGVTKIGRKMSEIYGNPLITSDYIVINMSIIHVQLYNPLVAASGVWPVDVFCIFLLGDWSIARLLAIWSVVM